MHSYGGELCGCGYGRLRTRHLVADGLACADTECTAEAPHHSPTGKYPRRISRTVWLRVSYSFWIAAPRVGALLRCIPHPVRHSGAAKLLSDKRVPEHVQISFCGVRSQAADIADWGIIREPMRYQFLHAIDRSNGRTRRSDGLDQLFHFFFCGGPQFDRGGQVASLAQDYQHRIAAVCIFDRNCSPRGVISVGYATDGNFCGGDGRCNARIVTARHPTVIFAVAVGDFLRLKWSAEVSYELFQSFWICGHIFVSVFSVSRFRRGDVIGLDYRDTIPRESNYVNTYFNDEKSPMKSTKTTGRQGILAFDFVALGTDSV